MISSIACLIDTYVQQHDLQSGETIPRSLDTVHFPMGEASFTRASLPFSLWKAQRIQYNFLQLSKDAQDTVNTWLSDNGHRNLMTIYLGPQLERHALATKLK